MAKATQIASVDEYIAAQPAGSQDALRRVRRAIRKALPAAAEVISYKMPTYKMGGKAVVYFAGWKQHYSLYPATAPLVAALKKELSPYEIEKGTIRFPLDKPVPEKLIARIAAMRGVEAGEA